MPSTKHSVGATVVRILVCVKRVPAPGSRINVTADGLAVDTAFLGFTTSPHEECAVEAAVQLAEAHGGHTTVFTVGPPEAEEQLRYAVSVGVEAATLLTTDGSDWDPQRTARAIVDAIREAEADAAFDLILFGNESADSGGFQVGVRVARALGRPVVNGAKSLSIADGVARVERESDGGRVAFELPLPAVVGVKEGINLPRYPTMKGRLASKKVAVTVAEPAAAPGGQRLVSLETPPEQVSVTSVLGQGPDAAVAVVDLLVEIGVVT
jgi:electron transfer flavoprotein beta subunit